MVADTSLIQRGMDVYGLEGEKVGEVVRVETEAPAMGRATGAAGEEMRPPSRTGAGSAVPPPDAMPDAPSTAMREIPLGATADKGRGTASSVGIAGGRGDIPAGASNPRETPGAAGMDAIRGAGGAAEDSGFVGGLAGATTPTGAAAGAPGGDAPAAPTLTPGMAGDPGTSGLLGATGPGGVVGSTGQQGPAVTRARGQSEPRLVGNATGGGDEPRIVVQDAGVLGVGARVLHIPLREVRELSDGRITLNCTRDEASARYGPGPSLDLDENAPVLPY